MIYDKFVEYFKDYKDCFCIIGGNAATILLNEDLYQGTSYNFRTTQDYDVVIIAEMKNQGFSQHFLHFIEDNGYITTTSGTNENAHANYYRFETDHTDVPAMIETFSHPELKFPLKVANHKTPVPEGEDPSLSAILLNKDYYTVLKEGIVIRDDLPILDVPYLIYFKARAHLDITKRLAAGESIGNRANKNKHLNDVCQLSLLLTPESINKVQKQSIPSNVKNDLAEFIDVIASTSDFKRRFRTIPFELRPDIKTVISQLKLLL